MSVFQKYDAGTDGYPFSWIQIRRTFLKMRRDTNGHLEHHTEIVSALADTRGRSGKIIRRPTDIQENGVVLLMFGFWRARLQKKNSGITTKTNNTTPHPHHLTLPSSRHLLRCSSLVAHSRFPENGHFQLAKPKDSAYTAKSVDDEPHAHTYTRTHTKTH